MSEIKTESSFASSGMLTETLSEYFTPSDTFEELKHEHSEKKLRPLVKETKAPDPDREIDREGFEWTWKYCALAAVVLLSSLFLSKLTISSCGFWATYENNYYKIVHGDEKFCYRLLEPTPIVENLRERVVGQDDAIKLIEGSLNLANREKNIQMGFVGGTGIGKTLTSNIIMSSWKWQQNVVSLIFDINFRAHLEGQEAFDDDLKVVTSQLSDCGFNLVIIDDVEAKTSTIERITRLDRGLNRIAKQNRFKVVLIVIFNSTGVSSTLQQQLEHFVLIEFNSFTKDLLDQCIEMHEKLYRVKLTPKEVEELKLVDFASSGCKTVAKKINLISTKKV